MKNIRTPRTLADASFETGHPIARTCGSTRWADWLLAVAIGAAIGAVLAYGGRL